MNVVFDTTHTIAQAVEPLRSDAMAKARQFANDQVARMEAKLSAADWNLNVVAPSPRSAYDGRSEYKTKAALRNLYSTVVTHVDTNNREDSRTATYTVRMDADRVASFVENAARDASTQYDSFICKMIKKIGACKSAVLEGSHVWGYSFLTVETAGGSEVWKTQQIVNVSVHGTVFNQWPSRKMKGGAA